jgi:hypothetical protein
LRTVENVPVCKVNHDDFAKVPANPVNRSGFRKFRGVYQPATLIADTAPHAFMPLAHLFNLAL